MKFASKRDFIIMGQLYKYKSLQDLHKMTFNQLWEVYREYVYDWDTNTRKDVKA